MPVPASRLARYELRRFRGRMPKAALVFVLLVPLLYGAIYLTANWDPYGKLHQLPVAVVNHDLGTTVSTDGGKGKRLDAGADLVANLHAGAAFDWHETDDAEAARGLAEGDYYLTLTVPADFSADLASGQGDDPQRARIELRRDDANGFVVGGLTRSAESAVREAVDRSAEESYFNAVFANLATIRSGLVDAADGSGRLADGLTTADQGAAKLDTGSATAVRGAKDLSTGAGSLADGLDTATTGSASLATGSRQVADGTQQLSDTVVPPLTALAKVLPRVQRNADAVGTALDAVAGDAAGRTDSIASDLEGADTDLATLAKDHPELADDPAFTRLSRRVGSAADRADTIAADAKEAAGTVDTITTTVRDAGDLTPKVQQAKDDVVALNRGAQQVATGARSLAAGISTADAGAHRLATGADDLYDGLVTLHDGAAALHTGLDALSQGAGTLHTSLQQGAGRIPALSADEQADAVQVLSSPADVQTSVDHPAGTYGRGLAPLFFGIALWVFGISVFLVVRPITGRALAGRASPLRLALAGWLPIATVAVAAGWLMLGVVWLFLGLAPVHPGLLLATVTVGALCFSAIAHLFRTALGTAGSSLLLVTLILQLSSSGGTYPGPLLPPFFAAVGPFLPLTYLIDAFRVTISGGLLPHLGRDLGLLALVGAAVVGLTVLVVRRRQQFGWKDLHPPLTAP